MKIHKCSMGLERNSFFLLRLPNKQNQKDGTLWITYVIGKIYSRSTLWWVICLSETTKDDKGREYFKHKKGIEERKTQD